MICYIHMSPRSLASSRYLNHSFMLQPPSYFYKKITRKSTHSFIQFTHGLIVPQGQHSCINVSIILQPRMPQRLNIWLAVAAHIALDEISRLAGKEGALSPSQQNNSAIQ